MGRISKVVIVGGRGVGKTAFIERGIYGSLITDKPYIPTIEDIYAGFVENEKGNKEKLRFYDTSGIEVKNRSLPHHYHFMADAYIIMFSVTDKLSFQLLTDIKRDIDKNKDKKDVPILLIGNKQDMRQERVVDFETAENWAFAEKLKYFESSVLERNSIIEPLVHLCTRLAQPSTKTSFPQLSMSRRNKD